MTLSKRPDNSLNKSVDRTLEDLSDDAFRQNGMLRRSDIDSTYLRRSINPDEALAIERALITEGIEIIDDSVVTKATFEGIPSSTTGTALDQLMGLARKFPLLTESEERELGYSIQNALKLPDAELRDPSQIANRILQRAEQAKAKFVTSNIKLVVKIAFEPRFRFRMDPEDLVQCGVIGLIKACEKYDPDWGTRFSTYAIWWIRQSISRGIDNHGSTIRLPDYVRSQISKFRRTRRSLGLSMEYRVSHVPMIATALGWDEAFTGRIAQLSEQKIISYNNPVGKDSSSTLGELISDSSLTPEEITIANNLAEVVSKLVDDLGNVRLADIVRRRFGFDGPAETLEQIGEDYGVTKERIRQLESMALEKLKRPARKRGLHKTFESS